MLTNSNRRSFIKAGGIVGSTVLAGCLGGFGGSGGSGPVLEYTNLSPGGVAEAFQEETGVELERTEISGGDAVSRIVNEANAGEPTADVITVPTAVLPSLSQYPDLLLAWDNPNRDAIYRDLPQFNSPDFGSLLEENVTTLFGDDGTRVVSPAVHQVNGTYYNTEEVSDPPVEFEDYLDDQWQGRQTTAQYLLWYELAPSLAVFDRSRSEAIEFIDTLLDQNLVYSSGTSNVVQTVVSGERPIGVFLGDILVPPPDDDTPISVTYPSNTTTASYCSILTGKGNNTEGAKEYVEFITSETGNEIFSETSNGLIPAHENLSHPNPNTKELLGEYVEQLHPNLMTPDQLEYFQSEVTALLEE